MTENQKSISRRDFLKISAPTILGLILSGCKLTKKELLNPTPQFTSTPTSVSVPTSTLSACTARAHFGDPKKSEYVLPYPVGERHRVIQTYCNTDGSHFDQLAYDFGMPIGAEVTAARSGEVRLFQDDKPDKSSWDNIGEYNYIYIEHEDGTVAFYAHLKQDSIVVSYGQNVETGQQIAKSGNSGFTAGKPQLHFGVYQSHPPQEGFDLAVNFRNTDGQLDDRGGLMKWKYYEALPY
jgi:murein DD-endopeptidase MepM/ murein hydrolase activator NlpD